jgi:pimeloyl-ACP methyl ester carboxylesterase
MAARTGHAPAADGRRLTYCDNGDPAATPVISHHGTPGSRLVRHPDEDAMLADLGLRMISYDRPGYGESDPQPGRRVVDAADDVAALADHLGIDRFAVVGTSGGGPHALACSARLGPRISRVGSWSAAPPRTTRTSRSRSSGSSAKPSRA